MRLKKWAFPSAGADALRDGDNQLSGLDPIGAKVLREARILASLDLREGMVEGSGVRPNSMVLTDTHVVHLESSGRRLSSSVAAVRDISVAKVESERRGPGEYAWGVLAIILGLLLWRLVEHQIGSIVAGAVVAALGIYLIADKLRCPLSSVLLILSREGPQVRCRLQGKKARTDAYDFISTMYARKAALEHGDAEGGRPLQQETGTSLGRFADRVFRGE